MMFDGLGSSAQHIRSGRIKALAVAAPKRSTAFPNVPTTAEVGMPEYVVSTWYGIWGVKGTPKDILDRMQAEVVKALNSPELREIWASNGSDVVDDVASGILEVPQLEIKRWATVTKNVRARNWTERTERRGTHRAQRRDGLTVRLDSPRQPQCNQRGNVAGAGARFRSTGH